MNPLIQLKTTLPLLIALALLGFSLSPTAQAVVPAPDGGYPGGNTAEGQNALLSLNVNAGTNNTAVGWFSLRSNVEGQLNTALGAGTLFNNTASRNTAIGGAAMFSNTTGSFNTAVGMLSLFTNSTGSSNTAIGDGALLNNTVGTQNTAIGAFALRTHTEHFNTAVGVDALSNSNARSNTGIGSSALENTTTGGFNTAVGAAALFTNTTGYNNLAVGVGAGNNVTTSHDVICIGNNVDGQNISNSCYIGNIFGATASSGTPVIVNSNHKLGTTTSSKRFKENIKPMDKASEALFSLRPVTFHYKKEIDPASRSQFGLVAEDVERVHPDLVVRDKEGKPYSVRYDQVNAMLLNEFLKARRQIDAQQQQIDKLTAGLQKVSAQLEASKPVPQVVNNP